MLVYFEAMVELTWFFKYIYNNYNVLKKKKILLKTGWNIK